jgi:hypothetical protein
MESWPQLVPARLARYRLLIELSQADLVVGDDLAAFVRSGVAIIVATRDRKLRAEITRAWGPEVSADGRSVTLCVSAPPGSKTRSNLAGNGAIAVTFSLPTTYRTVQMKGTAVEVGEPNAEQLARVDEHLAAFVDQVEQVGIPRQLAPTFMQPEFVSVTLEVRELYDQTPGPNAGSKL